MACDLHQLSIDLKHNLAPCLDLPALGRRQRSIGTARRVATTTRSASAKSTRPWRSSWTTWTMPAAKSDADARSKSPRMQSPSDHSMRRLMSRDRTEMDISIMKSDVDFKDPEASAAREIWGRAPQSNGRVCTQVLAARQVRPKTSKSDIIRGRRGEDMCFPAMDTLLSRWLIPVAHNEQSMWLDLDRQAKLNEAKAAPKAPCRPSRLASVS